MSSGPALLLCALPALSPAFLALDVRTGAATADTKAAEAAPERGVPALFSWGDVDGDGRLDLAAVRADGTLQLLTSVGAGRFEDATERLGLAGIGDAALGAWADYDGDGRLDLFVGARAGASRLLHNDGGTFSDRSAGSGITIEGAVWSAQWLDHDGDGRADLFVVAAGSEPSNLSPPPATALTTTLFRGLDGSFFERAELPLAGETLAPRSVGPVLTTEEEGAGVRGAPTASRPGTAAGRGADHPVRYRADVAGPSAGERLALGTPSNVSSVSPILGSTCASALVDQANPGACLQASSTPTLGRLFPLSNNLFVAAGGSVGIGTTTPIAKLHVAGTARVTDKLTLAPAGDTALDVSTGSIYKAGALFLHTKGGAGNTALGTKALGKVTSGFQNMASGHEALAADTSGDRNTASGHQALFANTTGDDNSASGAAALRANTTGSFNTASGSGALTANTTGKYNTASGYRALFTNTTGAGNTAAGALALFANTVGGYNTAGGYGALYKNTTGSSNTASGDSALFYNTTGNNNTASGARGLAHNTTGSFNTASGYSALFANTTGGSNTASGASALTGNTTGAFNTASGDSALYYNTIGNSNTACGASALAHNTTGNYNTASGDSALFSSTTGSNNSATGFQSLALNTTGSGNTASGRKALYSNTTGSHNTALGNAALFYNTSGTNNIAIGAAAGLYQSAGNGNITIGSYGMPGDTATTRIGATQTRTFIAGIRGAATGVANAIPVLIDSSGQLGTTFSSRRFKTDIRDMGDATARLFELRPVLFRYKQPQTLPGGQPLPPEYGLIAEEVAEILPDLVVYDDEGQPWTVKYHLLSVMLLNELEQLDAEYARALRELRSQLEEQASRLAALEARSAPRPPPASSQGQRGSRDRK